MKTGIYKILNTVSGKFYIGSALDINKRWRQHRNSLDNGQHRNVHLQRSWDKYGSFVFEFLVVEETLIEDLITREQHYIDTLNVCDINIGFNIAPTAGSSLGIKRTEYTVERIRASRLGKTLTEDHKANISKSMQSSQKFKDAMNSQTYKDNMRDLNLGTKNNMYGKYGKQHARSRPICQYTKDLEFVKEWESANMAARELKFNQGNITSCCKGNLAHAYGFVWRYANKKEDSLV